MNSDSSPPAVNNDLLMEVKIVAAAWTSDDLDEASAPTPRGRFVNL
ncbi:hypothetical protein TIFTF001_003805 [Ficus carica]|uniref:Uncharacterized protein n=1 Tax=Ficus carica TaxID=3494 RepID=A0AA88CWM3_FICCA|nr:hypothetical protein TIFTF001_003805 [Ficus carica]